MTLLSVCEEIIMMCIWSTNKPLNYLELRDMLKDISNKDWHPQTILTYLSRMKTKNFIYSVRNDERLSYYYPLISKSDYQQFVVKNLLSRLFDNSSQALLETLMKLAEREEKNG